ncbi:MAG TPA: lipase [Deltaproteobacteria bacterium]|jgi:triacylglycerol lipase|nr:lipase [Deltaproteobacteria bacterium]HOI08017.1 lipase [Deltaproteobacteria bacterium]
MKKLFIPLVTGVFLASLLFMTLPSGIHAAEEKNDCPIILAQSWSSETAGLYRVQALLNAQGYTAHTVSMGPISSAWDRACELYAQIKGGTVDYGEAHSRKHGHERYGRTYPGFYPEWGVVSPATRKPNKVHLMGFSFEGITCRVLVQLLEKGSAEEISETTDGTLSPLFAGRHSWVLSCTTLATPHDESTLLEFYLLYGIDSSSTLGILILLSEAAFDEDSVYDIDLDQWGFYNRPGESRRKLLSRLASMRFLDTSKDFSYYDLTPNGIYALNSWVKAQPFVYYFSLAANATRVQGLQNFYPIKSMTQDLKNYSVFMGLFFRETKPFPINGLWYPNDGVVNMISQNGPKVCTGNLDIISAYYGQAFPGIWNYLGVMNGVDHFQLIDKTKVYDSDPWFLKHAELLYSLEIP